MLGQLFYQRNAFAVDGSPYRAANLNGSSAEVVPVFIVDNDGAFIVDNDGAFIVDNELT